MITEMRDSQNARSSGEQLAEIKAKRQQETELAKDKALGVKIALMTRDQKDLLI